MLLDGENLIKSSGTIIEEHIGIQAGSNTQTGYQGNVVACTYIKTVKLDGIKGLFLGFALFDGKEITGTGHQLGKSLGTHKQHRGCENACNNLFHSIE